MYRRGMNRETIRMLQRMGVSFQNLENVEEVNIKFKDKTLRLINPQVMITNVSGQKIYQIFAESEEEIKEERKTSEYKPTEEDVNLVMEKAGVSKEEAEQALKETEGDIASAILLAQARKKWCYFFIKDYDAWVGITACNINKDNITNLINAIANKNEDSTEILQVVNLNRIVSLRQILSSIYRTYRSFERKRNIAKDKSVEVLLRLTGKRQIFEAISIIGVNKDTDKVIIFACDKNKSKVIREIENLVKNNELKVIDEEINSFEKRKEELIKIYNLKTNDIEKETLTKISSVDWYYWFLSSPVISLTLLSLALCKENTWSLFKTETPAILPMISINTS